MDLFADTLEYATWTITADVDLTNATAEVYLADAWRPLDWTGTSAQTGTTWTRTGQLLTSGANPTGGIKPTATDRQPLIRVTVGGEVIVKRSDNQFTIR